MIHMFQTQNQTWLSVSRALVKKALTTFQIPLILVLERESYQGDSNSKSYLKIQTKKPPRKQKAYCGITKGSTSCSVRVN